jgi:hypothetical protein
MMRHTSLLAAFWLKEDDINYVPQTGVCAQILGARSFAYPPPHFSVGRITRPPGVSGCCANSKSILDKPQSC